MTRLDLTSVAKAPGPAAGVTSLTMSIPSGSLTCLVGPAGAGKTTVLRLLAGFERPDTGTIGADGVDIGADPPERRRFAVVTGDRDLFPNLTVRQNIEFALAARGSGRGGPAADRLVDEFDLAPHAGKHPHELTAVQRVHTALARALACEPRVLLLDDPTAALGPVLRQAIDDRIRHLHSDRGVTTVVATQDPRQALAIADRIAVLNLGRLEQFAPAREVYLYPVSGFVADLTGPVNRIRADGRADGTWRVLDRTVRASRVGRAGTADVAAIRPECLVLDAEGPARVADVRFAGALTRVLVDDPLAGRLVVDAPSMDCAWLGAGRSVRVRLHEAVDLVPLIGRA